MECDVAPRCRPSGVTSTARVGCLFLQKATEDAEADEAEESAANSKSSRLLSGGVQSDAVFGALAASGAVRVEALAE